MPRRFPPSAASIAGQLYALLVPVPIICFFGTFFTDLVYWRMANMLWADMSVWLLAAGLVVAGFVVIFGLVAFFAHGGDRDLRAASVPALGTALILVLSIINVFIHSRDAYTSVVPTGLTLSGIVVLLLLIAGWVKVYRRETVQRSENYG
jgi:uncharacterized membrane protein